MSTQKQTPLYAPIPSEEHSPEQKPDGENQAIDVEEAKRFPSDLPAVSLLRIYILCIANFGISAAWAL